MLAGTISGGGLHLLEWQALTALWVIVFCAIGTFILLKLVGLFVPLRMTEEEMEEGDIAVHGHEVYPSDVPSLGLPGRVPRAAGPGTGDFALGQPGPRPQLPTEPPRLSRGRFRRSGVGSPAASARATSRRMSSIVATAGVTAAARGVAAKTLRTGLLGLSSRIAMSSRALARASCGIRATPTPAATRPCTVW